MAPIPQPWMLARPAIGGGSDTRRCASPGLAVRPGLAVFGDWAGPLAGRGGVGRNAPRDRASPGPWVGSVNSGQFGRDPLPGGFSPGKNAPGGSRLRRCDAGEGIHRRKRLAGGLVGVVGGAVYPGARLDGLGGADIVGAVPHGSELALEEGDGGAVVGE